MASALGQSCFAGVKAFSAKPARGMRAASRRNAVMTKAKVKFYAFENTRRQGWAGANRSNELLAL